MVRCDHGVGAFSRVRYCGLPTISGLFQLIKNEVAVGRRAQGAKNPASQKALNADAFGGMLRVIQCAKSVSSWEQDRSRWQDSRFPSCAQPLLRAERMAAGNAAGSLPAVCRAACIATI